MDEDEDDDDDDDDDEEEEEEDGSDDDEDGSDDGDVDVDVGDGDGDVWTCYLEGWWLSLPPTPHAGLPTINVSRSGSEYQALAAKDSSQAWKSEAPVKPCGERYTKPQTTLCNTRFLTLTQLSYVIVYQIENILWRCFLSGPIYGNLAGW